MVPAVARPMFRPGTKRAPGWLRHTARMNTNQIAHVAALVGEPARTAMLVALMDGRALTARELAEAGRVSGRIVAVQADQALVRDGGDEAVLQLGHCQELAKIGDGGNGGRDGTVRRAFGRDGAGALRS